jgi:hypothetical protein
LNGPPKFDRDLRVHPLRSYSLSSPSQFAETGPVNWPFARINASTEASNVSVPPVCTTRDGHKAWRLAAGTSTFPVEGNPGRVFDARRARKPVYFAMTIAIIVVLAGY